MSDKEKLLVHMRSETGAHRLTTLAARMGLSTERTRQALRQLLASGEVVYNGRGAYRVAA